MILACLILAGTLVLAAAAVWLLARRVRRGADQDHAERQARLAAAREHAARIAWTRWVARHPFVDSDPAPRLRGKP